MTMISYAQEGEDVVLQRAFARGHAGFYIDVGANDPVESSVTKHFYDAGWRGINIEPIPSLFAKLRDDRPRDVNLNLGLSNREGRLTFHELPERSGWSTFSPALADAYRARGLVVLEHEVEVTTLARVCERHVEGPIDVLKVDVEGLEREVLEGADWERWRPRVVVVENAGAGSWESLLLAASYRPAVRTEINRYYVREEDSALIGPLSAPANAGDDYIRHHHARVVRALGEELAAGDEFGPNSLRAAVRLHRAAVRHPRLAALGKSLLRLVG